MTHDLRFIVLFAIFLLFSIFKYNKVNLFIKKKKSIFDWSGDVADFCRKILTLRLKASKGKNYRYKLLWSGLNGIQFKDKYRKIFTNRIDKFCNTPTWHWYYQYLSQIERGVITPFYYIFATQESMQMDYNNSLSRQSRNYIQKNSSEFDGVWRANHTFSSRVNYHISDQGLRGFESLSKYNQNLEDIGSVPVKLYNLSILKANYVDASGGKHNACSRFLATRTWNRALI